MSAFVTLSYLKFEFAPVARYTHRSTFKHHLCRHFNWLSGTDQAFGQILRNSTLSCFRSSSVYYMNCKTYASCKTLDLKLDLVEY